MVEFSPIVATTVLDFIDYAAFAAIIMIIYYGIKVVFFQTKEEKDAENARMEGARDWVKEKYDKYKEKETERKTGAEKEAAERKRKLLFADVLRNSQALIAIATELADDDLQNKSKITVAGTKIRHISTKLHPLNRELRLVYLRKAGTDARLQDYFHGLYTYGNSILDYFNNNISGQVPPHSLNDAEWNNRAHALRVRVHELITRLKYLNTNLINYIEREETVRPPTTSGSGGSI